MTKYRNLIAIVCAVALLGSLMSLARGCRGKPSVKLGPYEALGARAADETAALLRQNGCVLILAADLDSPVIAAEVGQFQKTLCKNPGLSIAAVEIIQTDPLRSAQFVSLLKKHAGVAAVVSFYGFPVFTDDELAQLPQPLPKIVAILSGDDGARRLFAAGADGFILAGSPPQPQVIRAR
jgi:hypothetical protein